MKKTFLIALAIQFGLYVYGFLSGQGTPDPRDLRELLAVSYVFAGFFVVVNLVTIVFTTISFFKEANSTEKAKRKKEIVLRVIWMGVAVAYLFIFSYIILAIINYYYPIDPGYGIDMGDANYPPDDLVVPY